MNHLWSVKGQDQRLLAWLLCDPATSSRSSPAIEHVIDRMISGFRGHEYSRDRSDINFSGWQGRRSRMLENLFTQHRSFSHLSSQVKSLAIIAGEKQ
jgi:hypothetical protein